MKKLLQPLLLAMLFALGLTACNLTKTAVVRDTVKEVITTTPDYYDFYVPGIGEGTLKDYKGIISTYWERKELVLELIPSPIRGDEGYFILRPASLVLGDDGLESVSTTSDQLSITLGDLKEAIVPRRGN